MKVDLKSFAGHWHDVARILGNMKSLDINGYDGEAEISIDERGHVSIAFAAAAKRKRKSTRAKGQAR